MAYYDALIAKWATLTGTTDQKIAAVNALTVAGPRKPVQIADVMTYLRSNALWLPIKAAAAAGTSAGAEAAVDLNSDMRMQTIDFDLPIVAGMLADLVSKALLTQAQSDALNALANTTIPWWQATVAQGGCGLSSPVGANDLAAAGGLT
jgi:hypothetical protein